MDCGIWIDCVRASCKVFKNISVNSSTQSFMFHGLNMPVNNKSTESIKWATLIKNGWIFFTLMIHMCLLLLHRSNGHNQYGIVLYRAFLQLWHAYTFHPTNCKNFTLSLAVEHIVRIKTPTWARIHTWEPNQSELIRGKNRIISREKEEETKKNKCLCTLQWKWSNGVKQNKQSMAST